MSLDSSPRQTFKVKLDQDFILCKQTFSRRFTKATGSSVTEILTLSVSDSFKIRQEQSFGLVGAEMLESWSFIGFIRVFKAIYIVAEFQDLKQKCVSFCVFHQLKCCQRTTDDLRVEQPIARKLTVDENSKVDNVTKINHQWNLS